MNDSTTMEVCPENIKQEKIDWNPDPVDVKVKPVNCGEIHTLDYQNYILVCSVCGESFPDTLQFGNHYREKHVTIQPKTNISPAVVSNNVEEATGESGSAGLDFTLSEYTVKEEYLSDTEEDIESNNDEDPTDSNTDNNQQDISYDELLKLVKKPMSEFICDLCGRQCRNKRSVRRHLINKHKCVKCKYCEKMCATPQEFEEHSNTHDKERPYACPHCPKLYRRKKTRQEHIGLMHNYRKPEKCPECGKLFLTEEKLRNHMLTHALPGQHSCEICGQQFIYHSRKVVHMRQHTGEKPYQCQVCDKTFTLQSSLTVHMKRHNNQKDYECNVCGDMFYTSSSLKRHSAKHFPKKLFECPDCDRKFTTVKNLKIHHNVHLTTIEYNCDICEKKYSSLSTLSAHRKIHERNVVGAVVKTES